jgi:hypothetical protein
MPGPSELPRVSQRHDIESWLKDLARTQLQQHVGLGH